MRITAILNNKGGVGKTTTAINLATLLAVSHQKKVLLIDADAQANSTEFFGADPNWSLADVLLGHSSLGMCRQATEYRGLDILPANDALMDLDIANACKRTAKVERLRNELADAAAMGHYDYVFIDCPPSFSAACAAALLAAEDVVIPIKLDAFSLRGMANLVRQIAGMQKINPALHTAGILITMWYSGTSILEAEEILRNSDLPVYKTKIRRSDRVDAMTLAQLPLQFFSPRSAAGVDYRKFANEYVKGGRRNG